ncbi:hypothetical protein [Lihuaxuella thermophila]|nr:hypothetical protein [Lihuaxuella thermophila]
MTRVGIEVLYLSRIECKDCGRLIRRRHLQERKPGQGETHICPSPGCRRDEKGVVRYRRQHTIDNQEQKYRLLRHTPYKQIPVALIALGTITVSKYHKNQRQSVPEIKMEKGNKLHQEK